jgi:single-strand DNA-binding protein
MNNVTIIGNISTDIDLRATSGGKFVASFNVAVQNPFNREKVSFLPVEIWGKSAEHTSNFCTKGSKVGIVGYIEVDQWEKDGQKRSKTKVVGNSIEFLTPKNGQTQQQPPKTRIEEDPFAPGESFEIQDSDLPF